MKFHAVDNKALATRTWETHLLAQCHGLIGVSEQVFI
jgi:hypothetical protein